MVWVVRLLGSDKSILVHGYQRFLRSSIASNRPLHAALASRVRGRCRIQRLGWEHLRRGCRKIHGLDGGAVEFVEVQSLDFVEGVN